MSEQKILCSLETVLNIVDHPNADLLKIARVLGYDVVISPTKDEILVGSKVLMFFVDAVISPRISDTPYFAFLEKTYMGKRVKTTSIRGQRSQGILFSLNIAKILFPEIDFDSLPLGTNLTNETGTVKYFSKDDAERPFTRIQNTPQEEDRLLDDFPSQIPKTEQVHLQKNPDILENSQNRPVVVTLKVDGQSGTFFYDPETKEAGMCSRNFKILLNDKGEHPNSPQFVEIEKKYDILNKLKQLGRPLAIQGEIYGQMKGRAPINRNRMQASGLYFAVFGIYEWNSAESDHGGKYLLHSQVLEICKELDLPHVPVLYECPLNQLPQTIDGWMNLVDDLKYDSLETSKKGLPAEGIVCKSTDDNTLSFKVVSSMYLYNHKCG